MTWIKKYTMVLLLIVLLVGCNGNGEDEITGFKGELVFEEETFLDPSLNHYEIDAAIDTENDVIDATQILTYTHHEGIELDELYFHLYPNAFNKDKHPSLFDANIDEINTQAGYVEIKSVKINGIDANYEIGPLDTVLRIHHDSHFVRGQSYKIELKYLVGIPSASERFGVANGIYNLGNWYPVLAVFDESGWNLDPYYNIGDPFYSETSNYDVKVTVADPYILASSGYITQVINDGKDKTYVLKAGQVRDFALSLSKEFKILSSEVNKTRVFLYYPKDFSDSTYLTGALQSAVNAMVLYNDVIGDYPYKTYSVVITNFPSGMEYPGLVLISSDYLNRNADILQEVIVHETAHQWFYGIVGNDQIDDGWIDEGLTSYMTAYYNLEFASKKAYKSIVKNYKTRLESVGGKDQVIMLKSAKDYRDWTEYGLAAYTKSPLMFSQLYDIYGEEKMKEFLKKLYFDYKFKILKAEDLVAVAEEVFGENINEFFGAWLK